MPLIRNGGFVEDDWRHVTLDDPLPERGDMVVPFARLLRDWETLANHDGRLGVVFDNAERVSALTLFLPRLGLVVLTFSNFTDGRAYSIARQLREMGYSRELRAAGNVLPDQIQFMRQVGFDSFEVSDRFSPAVWMKAHSVMSLSYQRGFARWPGEAEVWSERHREADPWVEQPHAG